jgi:antitoxin HicB
MPTFVFEVVFEPDEEDGGFSVSVPALPEVATQGETIDEAKRRAEEAILLALETRLDLGWELPGRVDKAPARRQVTARGFRACVNLRPEAAFALA